jgi:predicted nucleic-acid-binding Zn-ribbon protein
MSETSHQCPKCHNQMEQGAILDHLPGGARILGWVKGVPRKSWWRGIYSEVTDIPIGSFRCTTCGYLELYARDEFGPR